MDSGATTVVEGDKRDDKLKKLKGDGSGFEPFLSTPALPPHPLPQMIPRTPPLWASPSWLGRRYCNHGSGGNGRVLGSIGINVKFLLQLEENPEHKHGCLPCSVSGA